MSNLLRILTPDSFAVYPPAGGPRQLTFSAASRESNLDAIALIRRCSGPIGLTAMEGPQVCPVDVRPSNSRS